MTKLREPLTLEKALVHIASVLPGGFDEMAEVTNRAPWLVRAWSDPDRRERLPMPDALLLDKACRAAGGGTPIAEYYHYRLEAAGAFARATPAALAHHCVAIVRECGEAEAAILDAALSGGDPAKAAEARRQVEEALAALHRALPMLVGRDAYDKIFARPGPEHAPGPDKSATARAPP